MALHQHCFFHTLPAWASHVAGGLSPSLLLGLRELQSPKLPGHWGWERHATGSTALHKHCSHCNNMVSQRTGQVRQALQLFPMNPTYCSPRCCWSSSVAWGGHQGWPLPLHSATEIIHLHLLVCDLPCPRLPAGPQSVTGSDEGVCPLINIKVETEEHRCS